MLVTVALTAHPLPSLLVFQAWKFCDLTNILSIEFFSAHISFYCLVVKSLPPCPQLTGPEADTGLMTDHSDYLSPDLGSVGYSDSPVLSRLMDSRHWSHLWGIKETEREAAHDTRETGSRCFTVPWSSSSSCLKFHFHPLGSPSCHCILIILS